MVHILFVHHLLRLDLTIGGAWPAQPGTFRGGPHDERPSRGGATTGDLRGEHPRRHGPLTGRTERTQSCLKTRTSRPSRTRGWSSSITSQRVPRTCPPPTTT